MKEIHEHIEPTEPTPQRRSSRGPLAWAGVLAVFGVLAGGISLLWDVPGTVGIAFAVAALGVAAVLGVWGLVIRSRGGEKPPRA